VDQISGNAAYAEFMIETRVSLIQRVREKQTDAWTEFLDIYRPLLVAYVHKRGVSEHDAADVVQDVFTRLMTALTEFELDAERGRFRTWLWRVTHSALTDWARRRAVRDRAERGWVDQRQPADDADADGEWNELYRRRILEAAIERVRASAQPITWACFEGRILAARPATEIAAETGVSINAVYVNASRLLARVREECATFEEPLTSL
jgi:RNA polymerase sigma-70 factor (ECF subfamily)